MPGGSPQDGGDSKRFCRELPTTDPCEGALHFSNTLAAKDTENSREVHCRYRLFYPKASSYGQGFSPFSSRCRLSLSRTTPDGCQPEDHVSVNDTDGLSFTSLPRGLRGKCVRRRCVGFADYSSSLFRMTLGT